MTTLTIYQQSGKDNGERKGLISGFELSGHAMAASFGKDILCAAISSAAYMAANTVTDVIKSEATALADDGYMAVRIASPNERTEIVLRGFLMHIEGLKEQYPKNIKIIVKEGVF